VAGSGFVARYWFTISTTFSKKLWPWQFAE
jgi:hypothetical protein